ncbi:MAG: hypothetical protein U0872_14850 [Planctomycetaceae bacterium]
MSLAFWLTLLVAAGLFGAVSLSPKLAAYLSLQDRYYAQQSSWCSWNSSNGSWSGSSRR